MSITRPFNNFSHVMTTKDITAIICDDHYHHYGKFKQNNKMYHSIVIERIRKTNQSLK